MSNLKISVVVCTYNRCDILKLCIESLINQTLNKNIYEIIIVNNNSTDATANIVREYEKRYHNIRLVDEKVQGLSSARNKGYQEAKGYYIAYIDDDGKATPKWLENILKAFENISPQPCVIGGPIYPFYLTEKPSWFLDKYEIRLISKESKFINFRNSVPNFSGSNMAFKKNVLESYHGFSTDFGVIGEIYRGGDEVELFKRIYKDIKYFWYESESIVEHFVPESKMDIHNILTRYFWNGYGFQKIKFKKMNFLEFLFPAMKWIMRIIYNFFILLFSVRWGKKGWQNNYIRHVSPLAGSIGALIALIELKYNIKIVD